jgi:beta-mannanase
LEPSKGALSITAQLLGSQARFKTIISLAQTRRLSKAIITRTTNLKNSVQARVEKRNRIVHDPWYAEQTTQTSAQFKNVPPSKSKSKNYSFGMKPTDTKYINTAIKEGKTTFKEVTALRVCPVTSCGITKPSEHEAD